MSGTALSLILDRMFGAATNAIKFTSGMSQNEFRDDLRTRRAVVMSLFIVGELSANVMDKYPDVASDNAEVPWHARRGMRNKIAHSYFSLETDIIWKTVQTSLPFLLETLQRLRKTDLVFT